MIKDVKNCVGSCHLDLCTVYLSSRRETLDWMLDPRSISIALIFFFAR